MRENKDVIFLVDIQSFYASVEIASDPNLVGKPVVVCGDPEKRHGIVLAASPEAKQVGVKTGMPAWQVKNICPNASFVMPHMQKYIDTSIEITEILSQFSEQTEVFSIDEQFLNITDSQSLFGPPEYIAKMIQKRIWDEIGVWARVGIGDNKIQAKMACDNFAKKNQEGIFKLSHDNYKFITAPLSIGELFGVGRRMKQNLERIGIKTIGELAKRPLEEMKRRWGIAGHVLWLSAKGLDDSPVESHSTEPQKGVGNSITLPRDYHQKTDIEIILLELTEEVCRRARLIKKRGKTIHLLMRGADFDHPTGFSRQISLPFPTNHTMEIYQMVIKLFVKFWDGKPVRSIGVSLSQLEVDDKIQLSLFDDQQRKIQISKVMDEIRTQYGKTAIFRASSLLPAGLLFERTSKIGGHEA